MKGFDYSVEIKDSKTYETLRPVGKKLADILYKIEYVGAENIPAEGGFILASNHLNALDPVFIALGIENRQLHFMGKKELFENPFAKAFLTKLNGFPIVRGSADSEALNYAVRVAAEGNILGIFPEGTRSKDYKPARAKSGVAMIANQAKVPVLPVSIYNCDEMKRKSRITIRFGELIPYEKLGLSEDASREEIKGSAKMIMGEIVKLWEMGHCE
ncbi:MAG: 1-acyl-sn-glycerol-3-phosphate acyltransferase [Clostridia bacterium]|nr:1-acyl-sn-glycerol-3-phosphate acyltransferase [Clostridia bacterium]MBQ4605005.1 1-acyl-sn-glycerol-3-phosphate acyltransferase [Clostridia bacterium]